MKPNTHRNKSLNVHPVIKPRGGAGETAQRRQHYRQKREGQVKNPPTGKRLKKKATFRVAKTSLALCSVREEAIS